MTRWTLTLKQPPSCELDVAVLSSLPGITRIDDVRQVCLATPRPGRTICVGDLFDVSVNEKNGLTIVGDLRRMHRIGYRWAGRMLEIIGSAGVMAGAEMRGGNLHITGDADNLAASQMRGGVLQIDGDAGDDLGGPQPGYRAGMNGGRVVVAGNAGHRAGHRMRRGTIVIGGGAGDCLGADMVAGTIVVNRRVGDAVAAGMRRGTIILGTATALDAVRFSRQRIQPIGVANLIANDLTIDAADIAARLRQPFARSVGDLSAGGQGEVLILGFGFGINDGFP